MFLTTIVMFTFFLQTLALASVPNYDRSTYQQCKPIPGDRSWPSQAEWAKLNSTLSGRLISPPPPGGVCHPSYPTFDPLACPAVASRWGLNAFHASNPISNTLNNWNNDTCIPIPGFPCSGAGYPVYVVNATSVTDVQKGVNFARKTGVRLIVKGTGHDYLGRSQAPNALSIWTYHLKGLRVHNTGAFKPKSCMKSKVTTAAITVGAGVPMIDINIAAAAQNLTIVSGGAATVGLGGYLSGGGHGAISHIFGLAADNVLEMEVVTPDGKFVTANECLNSDLFWALRGGGGATFGVMISATIRAFPSFRFAVIQSAIATPSSNTDNFWNGITQLFTHFPSLADAGISAYTETVTNFNGSDYGIPFQINAFQGTFQLPLLHPSNSTASLTETVYALFSAVKLAGGEASGVPWFNVTYPGEYPDFYTYYKDHNGPQDGGQNQVLASRLLDKKALTGDRTLLKNSLIGAGQSGGLTAHLVSGPGVHDTSDVPGGSNAVCPGWRKAYIHAIIGARFPPLDPVARRKAHDKLTYEYSQYLRELAPDGGSYVNEGNLEEIDYQKTFWGGGYERLRKTKKWVDPQGMFWCKACVGGEDWGERVGGDGRVRVCRG